MTDVFARVLSISLSGAVVALAVLLLCRLFGQTLSKGWRYYVWLIVLLRLVIPFAPQGANLMDVAFRQIAGPGPAAVQTALQPPPAIPVAAPGLSGAFPEEAAAETPPTQAGGTLSAPETIGLRGVLADLWQYAWVVWLGVALMLLVRAITGYQSFTRFIRAGWQPMDDPAALDALDDVRMRYGLRRTLPVYLNPLATSPMLVGIVRPVIVLPACPMDGENLRHIFVHELIHHKRRDILYKWAVQVICCLHWFNPVVYLVRKEINTACELSCDARVLARMQPADHRQYGDTLLTVLQSSGHFGDTVASITMSEEGNIMKKRLESIAHPHKRSKVTLLVSLFLSVLLLFGAAYAGAYTGTPQPTDPAPEATQTPTPGERLDSLLTDLGELRDSVEQQAKERAADLSEKVDEWAQHWSDAWLWDDGWHWDDAWDWDEMVKDEENMFSSYRMGDRTVIYRGYYENGTILQLQYDSALKAGEGGKTVFSDPAVWIPETLQSYAEDAESLAMLKNAAAAFREAERDLPEGALLTLVNVFGPYEESPDTLLNRFYEENKLGHFVAVLNSGLVSTQQQLALLTDAAQKGDVVHLSILLSQDTPVETVDALLQKAYDRHDIASFSILMEFASDAARLAIMDQATRDKNASFLASLGLPPSDEAIESMLVDPAHMSPATVSILSGQLTHEQALRIAEAAYGAGNISVFSVIMDQLPAQEREAFRERAHQDGKIAFYAILDDFN